MNDDEWTKADSVDVAESVRPVIAMILSLDREKLANARRELEKWDSAAPLVDPTAWMNRNKSNDIAIERLTALIECYDTLMESGDRE